MDINEKDVFQNDILLYENIIIYKFVTDLALIFMTFLAIFTVLKIKNKHLLKKKLHDENIEKYQEMIDEIYKNLEFDLLDENDHVKKLQDILEFSININNKND